MIEMNSYCPICEERVKFLRPTEAKFFAYREGLICLGSPTGPSGKCNGSIPRERALMNVLSQHYPNWRDLHIHESSPCHRGVSLVLNKECQNYTPSHFFEGIDSGQEVDGVLCQDLTKQSFEDESFDLQISLDVFEHLFEAEKAFKEIARTLKTGGAAIFTVPLVRGNKNTIKRAILENNKIKHLEEPDYHGNPVGNGRSLVTYEWGYDICEKIYKATNLKADIINQNIPEKGIEGWLTEVIIFKK